MKQKELVELRCEAEAVELQTQECDSTRPGALAAGALQRDMLTAVDREYKYVTVPSFNL